MTFAEQLYDYLQRFQYWTLWQARLVRVLESGRTEAVAYVAALENRFDRYGEVALAWPDIKLLLPIELPDVLTALDF